MLSYPLRVVFLVLACGYLLHAALMLAARLASPVLDRWAAGMAPRAAANWALAWRAAPAALTAAVIFGAVMPVYLRFEPARHGEAVGMAFLLAAALGAAVSALALARNARAVWSLRRLRREFRRGARKLCASGPIAASALPVWRVRAEEPFVLLAGMRRPRVLISTAAYERLTAPQLEAALRHEQAHQAAGDNWRRWLLLSLPDALPGWHWRSGDERWTRYSEWAADEAAAGDEPWRALDLAEALLAIGRGGKSSAAPAPGGPSPSRYGAPVTGLASDGRELAARVERLLAVPPAPPGRQGRPWPAWAVGAAGLAALALAAMLLFPRAAALYPVLERLVR